MKIWATEKYNILLKRSWKVLLNGNIFENDDWNYYHQKPETNPETWYVNETFWIMKPHWKSLKRSWKCYLMVVFSEKSTETITIKNLKLIFNLCMSMKNFWVIVECYISLERSSEGLFNANICGNDDWNYYHLKPQTCFYVYEKIFRNNDILYIVEMSWKCFSLLIFLKLKIETITG